jgi:hypothetical protein
MVYVACNVWVVGTKLRDFLFVHNHASTQIYIYVCVCVEITCQYYTYLDK